MPPPALPIDDVTSAYYLRVPSQDRPGVFARLATILSEHEISIDAALQREDASRDSAVPIVILTHTTRESTLRKALAQVEALPDVVDDIVCLRVEHLA